MTPELIIQLGRDALIAVLLISAPLLGASLLIGLIISVFQATTQIQEATLTFVPKIIAVLIVIMLFGPWMLQELMRYTDHLLGALNQYTFIR
ncbi:flagellar biosynthesis protein FliQ [Heliobacillus mobilis]|uniref:Flagellar biosynthetic protein FliQ n=1 Tax=Heliobacterium mobile TaxID=28064 RepID=A0A6I3SFF4_HELMO|nr:flagellar biosynthesis protein FliQ [Heliobacterium mobile]MTV47810.1 flagellar biosynthesis protein FliQ [Heliobacterium mobile]